MASKADFATIGSPATLLEIMPELDPGVAAKVMDWAVGHLAVPVATVSDAPEHAEQSRHRFGRRHLLLALPGASTEEDYKTGDLCPSCGKQAEPVQSCYWCGQSGPGKFCRGCGAEFVPLAEFDLAVLLKREGVAKDEIAKRLYGMPTSEKDILWGRVRRVRG